MRLLTSLLFFALAVFPSLTIFSQTLSGPVNLTKQTRANDSVELAPAVTFTASPNVAIPNDGYNGTIASMSCSTIAVSGLPANSTLSNATVAVNLVHTFVGQLTIKLLSPGGSTLTILNRPGSTVADDGSGTGGDNANWNGSVLFRDGAAVTAENMGSTSTNTNLVICTGDGICEYSPAPQTASTPPSNFGDLDGQAANGNWQLCVGDSATGDTGTFVSWTLDLTVTSTFAAAPAAPVTDNGYIGGFATAGMTCSNIDTTGLLLPGSLVSEAYIDVNMTHTWVGDLTIKLRSPAGTILTVLNRPGSTAADTGADTPVGDSTNWNGTVQFRDLAPTTSETMGNTLTDGQTVCTNDGRCRYTPSPDTATTPPTTFANAFNGQNAVGVWTLCVGDSVAADTGTLNSWSLKLPNNITPTAANVEVFGRLIGRDGKAVRGATVQMASSEGKPMVARTNSFGYFYFSDVPSGESYVISVFAKGRSFQPTVVVVNNSIDDLIIFEDQ